MSHDTYHLQWGKGGENCPEFVTAPKWLNAPIIVVFFQCKRVFRLDLVGQTDFVSVGGIWVSCRYLFDALDVIRWGWVTHGDGRVQGRNANVITRWARTDPQDLMHPRLYSCSIAHKVLLQLAERGPNTRRSRISRSVSVEGYLGLMYREGWAWRWCSVTYGKAHSWESGSDSVTWHSQCASEDEGLENFYWWFDINALIL